MLSAHLRMYALSAIQRNGQKNKKGALRKAEQLTVRLRTRRSHILRWAVGALDWYHIIWILNYSLDDYFNRADCKPDLLPALRAFGEPLRAVCLFRSEQAQAAKVWTITHGLGKRPSVTVVDSAGTAVIGEIEYLDDNTVRLTFCAAFSGTAYCN